MCHHIKDRLYLTYMATGSISTGIFRYPDTGTNHFAYCCVHPPTPVAFNHYIYVPSSLMPDSLFSSFVVLLPVAAHPLRAPWGPKL